MFNGIVLSSQKNIILYVYNNEFYELMYDDCLYTDIGDALPVVAKAKMGYNIVDTIEYLYKYNNETIKIKLYVYDIVDEFYFDYGNYLSLSE